MALFDELDIGDPVDVTAYLSLPWAFRKIADSGKPGSDDFSHVVRQRHAC